MKSVSVALKNIDLHQHRIPVLPLRRAFYGFYSISSRLESLAKKKVGSVDERLWRTVSTFSLVLPRTK